MLSAEQYPEIVDPYLAKECSLGRVRGPWEATQLPYVHINRFGVIPKPHQQGEWRLIVDLSHPAGGSVNDGIEADLCSLKYPSVDDAVRKLLVKTPGMLMAKVDIENAYQNVPVHPDDWQLLGMRWRDRIYVDMAQPFGLWSAPKIFNALADSAQWVLGCQGVDTLHYLDDFLIFRPPNRVESSMVLEKVCQVFTRLGFPIATHKTECPGRRIVFLGIVIDAEEGVLRLPEEKLRWLQRTVRECEGRKTYQETAAVPHR